MLTLRQALCHLDARGRRRLINRRQEEPQEHAGLRVSEENVARRKKWSSVLMLLEMMRKGRGVYAYHD